MTTEGQGQQPGAIAQDPPPRWHVVTIDEAMHWFYGELPARWLAGRGVYSSAPHSSTPGPLSFGACTRTTRG